MDMQDKEFDKLFHSKLDNFEVQPSPVVWEGVARQLNAGKRKRILAPILSIAASIIILLAAGILFIPKKENVSSRQPVKNKNSKSSIAVNGMQTGKKDTVKLLKNHYAVNRVVHLQPAKTNSYIAVKYVGAVADTLNDAKVDEQPVLASAIQKQQEIVKPDVPDVATQLTTVQPVDEAQSFITKPALTAVQLPAADKQDTAPVKRKHNIRSFGDLINVVVAKVDKRQDKFIEFTDTDDDEATITGINLGILKIKKDK
jgi:hypothetical protein